MKSFFLKDKNVGGIIFIIPVPKRDPGIINMGHT